MLYKISSSDEEFFGDMNKEITREEFSSLCDHTSLSVFYGPQDVFIYDEHTNNVYAYCEYRNGVYKYVQLREVPS